MLHASLAMVARAVMGEVVAADPPAIFLLRDNASRTFVPLSPVVLSGVLVLVGVLSRRSSS